MAKFWQHIKGFCDTNGYTHIKWTSGLPTISYYNSLNSNTETDFGTILTSGKNGVYQSVYGLTITNGINFGEKNANGKLIYSGTNILLENCNFNAKDSSLTDFKINQGSINNATEITGVKGQIGAVQFNESNSEYSLVASNAIKAAFFNTASDQRLKENIFNFSPTEADFLVKTTPIYTFDYKDTHLSSIGMLAQDWQHYNFNGFEMTSEDENGMLSLKESKLVYILWAAVQNLQHQIQELQTVCNELLEERSIK